MRSIPCLFVVLCVALLVPSGRVECASAHLDVVTTTMTQIVLRWNVGWPSSVSSFDLQRATNSSFTANLKTYTLANDTLVFSDTNRAPISKNRFMGDSNGTNLATGTTYYYRVKAHLAGGSILTSNVVSAQVSGPVRGQEGDLWADIVLGKIDFGTNAAWRPSKFGASMPGGVLIDKTVTPNRMYIADCNNNRILGFTSTSPTNGAAIVLGQPDFFSGAGDGDSCAQLFPYRQSASAGSLCFTHPTQISMGETVVKAGMALDSQGNLFVADVFNNRVLKYNNPFSTDTIADEVWGQADFTGNQPNRGGTTPANNTLYFSDCTRIALGPDGSLWVADAGNNRVLRFTKSQTTGIIAKSADLCIGQQNFTSRTDWGYGRSMSQLWYPTGIGFDTAGNMYVSDGITNNSAGRLLVYQPPFTSGMAATRQMPLPIPVNVTDPATLQTVVVASIVKDVNPNRMWFENGQNTGASELIDVTTGTVIVSVPFDQSSGIDVDSDGNLYAVNKWGGVYRLAAPGWQAQPVFTNGNNATADSTSGILGMTILKDQLIISEASRMLIWNKWNVNTATMGQPADDVYGEPNFVTIGWGHYFASPNVDTNGRLWVCTRSNGHTLQAFAYPLNHNSQPVKSIPVSGSNPGLLPVKGGGTLSAQWADFLDFAVVGTGDKIWVADRGGSRVFRINNIDGVEDQHSGPYVDIILGQNNSTDTTLNMGLGQTTARGLAWTYNVDISPNGELMLADNGGETGTNQRIIIYEMTRFPNAPATCLFANDIGDPDRVIGTGGRFDISGGSGSVTDPTCSPFEVGISSNETVVAGMNGYSAQRFPLVYLDPRKSTEPQMALGDFTGYPTTCFVDKDGNVYVGDWDWSRVLVYKKPFKAFTADSRIGGLKGQPDGFPVSLTGNIVTAAPGQGGVPTGVFYVEAPDRSAGIRVSSTTVPTVGQTAAVNGTMATTAGGERYVAATAVFLGPGSALGALGSNTSDLSTGLMEGLLVRASGIVRAVGADSFTIADGFFRTGAEVQTVVKTGTAPGVTAGDFVSVNGIASREGTRNILSVPSTHTQLSGHVYAQAGAHPPIAGASITVNGSVAATTDANGYYQVWDPPIGNITLGASASGYLPQSIAMNIPAGANLVQDFYLVSSAPAVLSGTVTADLLPFGGAIIGIKPAASGGYALADAAYYVKTDDNGFYTLAVPPGDYLVAAWPHCNDPYDAFIERYAMSDNVPVSVVPGATTIANFDITEHLGPNVARTSDPDMVTASQSPGSARNAFNGTRMGGDAWYVPSPVGQWIKRDFGENPPAVDTMVYGTDWRRATGFIIAFSDDDVSYTTAFQSTGSTGGYNPEPGFYWEMVKLPDAVTARYWRITITESTSEEALHEFELYKTDSGQTANVKALPSGSTVMLSGYIVTAAPGEGGVPPGIFYMEAPDRSAGMRVTSTTVPTVGQSATVRGVISTTAGGERYIVAEEPVSLGAGSALRALGGNTKDLSAGLMDGLLVRASGIVRAVGSDWFSIADGFFRDGAEVQTVVETGTAPGVEAGEFVSLTGIASREGTRTILRVP